MDVVLAAMAKSGVTIATKEMMTRIMRAGWGDYLAGRKALRYLDSSDGFINYIEKHVSLVNRIRTIHSNEADVFLNDIYYPLTICEVESDFDFSYGIEGENNGFKIDDHFFSFKENLINIIGIAGQGKSTILRKAFMQAIFHGDDLPIFIELRLAEKNGIENSILKTLKFIGIDANPLILKEILNAKKISLFLDGFDEISSSNRSAMLSEIIELNLTYGVKIVTTSRPETEICHTSNIKNMKVKKLNRKDVIGIIKKLSQNAKNGNENDTIAIIKKIEEEDKLSQVMVSPILVTLLYVCYPYMDITPNNHVEFYADLFNTLYLRHDKLKGYTREKKSTLSNTLAFNSFCAFSFICLQKNHVSMKHYEMIENVRLSLKNISLEKPEDYPPENLCDDFIDVTCLIQKDGYQRYSFLHKSICEFHAASFIDRMGMDTKPTFYKTILDKIYSDNQEILNTVAFLKQLDPMDFAKNLTIPLLEKIGANKWDEPSTQEIDYLIDNTIKGSVVTIARDKEKLVSIVGIRFEIKNIWVGLYDTEFESENESLIDYDIGRIIFGVIFRRSAEKKMDLNIKLENKDRKEMSLISIIDIETREVIRLEVKKVMILINKYIYKSTKKLQDSSKENMLSLLNIS